LEWDCIAGGGGGHHDDHHNPDDCPLYCSMNLADIPVGMEI